MKVYFESDRNRNSRERWKEGGYVAVDVKLIDFSFCRLGIEGVLSLPSPLPPPALRSAKMPGLRERGGRNLWLILTAAPPCVRKFSHARFSNSPRSVPFSPFDRLHGRCCLPSSPRASVVQSVEFNHRQRCDRRHGSSNATAPFSFLLQLRSAQSAAARINISFRLRSSSSRSSEVPVPLAFSSTFLPSIIVIIVVVTNFEYRSISFPVESTESFCSLVGNEVSFLSSFLFSFRFFFILFQRFFRPITTRIFQIHIPLILSSFSSISFFLTA